MKMVIKGGPGTGKTTELLKLITTKFDPRKTMFVSFARKTIKEARERAEKTYGLESGEIKYFRTLHSICFRLMGLNKEYIFGRKDIKNFFEKRKIEYSGYEFEKELEEGTTIPFKEPSEEETDGEKILRIIDLLKYTKMIGPLDIKEEELRKFVNQYLFDNDVKFEANHITIDFLIDTIIEYEKEKGGKVDYTDTLLNFYKNPVFDEDIEVLIVDEFQDLNPLMYQIVKFFESKTKIQIYAGDEQQSIYSYMGASPKFLINEFNSADKKEKLLKTYRIGKGILAFIKDYENKNMKDRINVDLEAVREGGEVVKVEDELQLINILRESENKDTLFLHRSNYQKRKWRDKLVELGIRFREVGRGKQIWTDTTEKIYSAILKIRKGKSITYEEALKLIKIIPTEPFLFKIKEKLKRGEFTDIFGKPLKEFSIDFINRNFFKYKNIQYIAENLSALRIKDDEVRNALETKLKVNPTELSEKYITLSTIHASKGGEADIVIVNCQLPEKIKDHFEEIRDDEARVFYVAITRVRDKLVLYKSSENELF
jgi:superfamily I DNA/RNA helicase